MAAPRPSGSPLLASQLLQQALQPTDNNTSAASSNHDNSEVKSMVERAVRAWNEEFQLVSAPGEAELQPGGNGGVAAHCSQRGSMPTASRAQAAEERGVKRVGHTSACTGSLSLPHSFFCLPLCLVFPVSLSLPVRPHTHRRRHTCSTQSERHTQRSKERRRRSVYAAHLSSAWPLSHFDSHLGPFHSPCFPLLSGAPAHLPLSSPLASPPSIPTSVALLVRLPALLAKLRDQAVITRPTYLQQVLRAAQRLKAVQQDEAAKRCYEEYLRGIREEQEEQNKMNDITSSTSSSAVSPSSSAPSTPSPLTGPSFIAHIQALYGLHECSFRLLIARDPTLTDRTSSYTAALTILQAMQDTIDQVLHVQPEHTRESLSFLVYNGVCSLIHMLDPLVHFGYRDEEVVSYLNYLIQSMEYLATLSSVNYLPLRMSLYIRVARIFEWKSEYATAFEVAQRGLHKVREVATWESIQQPVPASTHLTLTHCATAMSIFLVKYSYLQDQLLDEQLQRYLEMEFNKDKQGVIMLLELLNDPKARTCEVLQDEMEEQLRYMEEVARVEEAARKTQDEVALQQAMDAAAAMQSPATGRKSAGKGRVGGGSGGGATLSSEAILAEVAAATNHSSSSTDRTTHRGGKAPTSKKKRDGTNEDEDASHPSEPQLHDVRDARAVTLVGWATRKLQELLRTTTPLSIIDAQAIGVYSLMDLISPTSDKRSSSEDSQEESTPQKRIDEAINHDIPGDWITLHLIFQVAKAAFTTGCWVEFEEMAREFDARVGSTSSKQLELELDRTTSMGVGMEVQLQVMRTLVLVKENQVKHGRGSRGIDLQHVRQLAQVLRECANQASSPSAADASITSPTSPTSPSATTSCLTTASLSPSTLTPSFLALSKSPDLFSDACMFLWRFYLRPMVLLERSLPSKLPPQIHPPRRLEDALTQRTMDEEKFAIVAGPSSPLHTHTTLEGLRALIHTLMALRQPDVMWLSQLVLELVHLLRTEPEGLHYLDPSDPYPTPSKSSLLTMLSVLRPTIGFIEDYLGQVVVDQGLYTTGGTIHSILAHFNVRVIGVDNSNRGRLQTSAAENPATSLKKPLTTPLNRHDSTLQCVYSDLLMALYDTQLRLGLIKAVTSARAAYSKYIQELDAKYAISASYRKKPDPLLLPTFNPSTEKKLIKELGANLYKQVLLHLVMLEFRSTQASQQEFIDHKLQPLLEQLAHQESDLLRYTQIKPHDVATNVGGGDFILCEEFTTPSFLLDRVRTAHQHAKSEAERMALLKKNARTDRLPAPRLIARSHNSLIIRPLVTKEYQRRHGARGVIVFGKPSETGVDVSTRNCDTFPLGVEFALPALDSDDEITDVVIPNLQPNTSYVFACIAVDFNGELIDVIGATTPRIVTCLPTPTSLMHGYLACTLRRLGDAQRLTQEATTRREREKKGEEEKQESSTALVSSPPAPLSFHFPRTIATACWNMLAPFIRIRPVSSHTRLMKPGARFGAARALGDGDRLNYDKLGVYSDEEDSEEQPSASTHPRNSPLTAAAGPSSSSSSSRHITSYSTRHSTNGVHDSYTLGPSSSRDHEFRMDLWQLSAGMVQAAPRAEVYVLAQVAAIHADCVAIKPIVPANTSNTLVTKPLALQQLHSLEVLRSLLLSLQLNLLLHEWREAIRVLLRSFHLMATTLMDPDGGVPLTPHSQLVLHPLWVLFDSTMLIRRNLSYEQVSPALQRVTTRIVHGLVVLLEARHEDPDVIKEVLMTYQTIQVDTFQQCVAKYKEDVRAYKAKQAAIDLAKMRASQLREALEQEAAAERARREKEAAKEAAKRSKKESGSKPSPNARKMDGGSTSTSHPSTPLPPSDDDPSPDSLDQIPPLPSNPAIDAILHHPLLNASAGHEPKPEDYFRVEPEDEALVQYLLSIPRWAEFGEKLAKSLLGRNGVGEGDDVGVDGLKKTSSDSSASSTSTASSSKKKGNSQESDEGQRRVDKTDIDIMMSDALHKAVAQPAGVPTAAPGDKASAAPVHPLLECFNTLRTHWVHHVRFALYVGRIVRAALDRGEVSIAQQVLDQVDEVDFERDPRFKTEEEEEKEREEAAAAKGRQGEGEGHADNILPPLDDATAAPTSSLKSPSTKRPKGQKGVSEGDSDDSAHPIPVNAPKYTSEQLCYLAELEVLRAHLLSIELDAVRMAHHQMAAASTKDLTTTLPSPSPSQPPQPPSTHNALGWEWEVERASKLRPSTMGLIKRSQTRAPTTTTTNNNNNLTIAEEEKEDDNHVKLPPLPGVQSPRSASMPPLSGRKKAASTRPSGTTPRSNRDRDAVPTEPEPIPLADPTILEFLRLHRLGRAMWLSHRARSLMSMQHVVGHILNVLYTGPIKLTPPDLAVKSFWWREEGGGRQRQSNTSRTDTSVPSLSLPSPSSSSSSSPPSPVSTLHQVGLKLLDMLTTLRDGASMISHAPDQVRNLHWQLFEDVPAVAHMLTNPNAAASSSSSSSTSSSTRPLWFLHHPDLHLFPVLRLLRFITSLLFHSQRWHEVIQVGRGIHEVFTGVGAFSGEVLMYVIYAAEEERHTARMRVDEKEDQIRVLRDSFEADARVIMERRDSRRSQRGKREEEERLAMLQQIYDSKRLPLEQQLSELQGHFHSLDQELTTLRRSQSEVHARDDAPWSKSLLHARFKLLQLFNDRARNDAAASSANQRGSNMLGDIDEDQPFMMSRPVSRGGSDADRTTLVGGGDDEDTRSNLSMSTTNTGLLSAGAAAERRSRKLKDKLVSSVIKAYTKAIADARSSGRPDAVPILGRMLHEQGDLIYQEYGPDNLKKGHYDETKTQDAFTAWHDALDLCFGTLQTVKQREKVLAPYTTASGVILNPSDTLLSHKGLWTCFNGLLAAVKLGRLQYFNDQRLQRELVYLGAALARTLFHVSLTHPARDVDFARYQCEELWSGVSNPESLFGSDPLRVRVGQLVDGLEFLSSNLVAHGTMPDAIRALPIITLYEWVARVVCRNVFHTVRARTLKVQACLAAGLLTEASELYIQIMEGMDLPKATTTGLTLKAHASGLPQPQQSEAEKAAAAAAAAAAGSKKKKDRETSDGSSNGGANADGSSEANTKVPVPPFHSHYPPTHPANRAFISYLLGELNPSSHSPTSALAALYGGYLWCELRFLRASFLQRLGEVLDQSVPGSNPHSNEDLNESAGAEMEAMLAALKARASKNGAKGKKGRPDSGDGTRVRSAGRDRDAPSPTSNLSLGGSGASMAPTASLAEKAAFRSMLLRAAERLLVELIVLFVPHDPNGGGADAAVVAPPVPPPSSAQSKKGSRSRGSDDGLALAAAAAAARAARRRSIQLFPDLVKVWPVAGTDESTPSAPIHNPDLLNALARDTTLHPAALVARAYSQMAALRSTQGLDADAEYFAIRSLRVMQENEGSEEESAKAQAAAPVVVAAPAPAAPIPPLSSRVPSPALSARDAKKEVLSPLPSGRGGRNTPLAPSPPPTAPPAGPPITVSSTDLLVVPPAPGAYPLHWRQLLDGRTWLRARLQLAAALIAQNRLKDAREQLEAVQQEASLLFDHLALHRCAVLTARMFLVEGKYLQAFHTLSKVVWREPNDAACAARAALLAKTPGGEAALPPPMPHPNNYAADGGEALLLLLQFLRRLPQHDHLDSVASKGNVHGGWILEKLEEVMLDTLELFGVRPSDVHLADSELKSAELRASTSAVSALPPSARPFQSLVAQHRPGVVSLYLPFLPHMFHFHHAMSIELLLRRSAPHRAMQYALVGEKLLSLWGGHPPCVRVINNHLIARIAWAKVKQGWKDEGQADLDVGMDKQAVAAVDKEVALSSVEPQPSKPSSTTSTRPPSPSSRQRTVPATEVSNANGAEAMKKRGKEAAAATAAQNAAPSDSQDSGAASSSSSSSTPSLMSAEWESSLGALPKPIRSLEPRSIASILSRLHQAVQDALLYGVHAHLLQGVCELLVEIHMECKVAEEQQAAKGGKDAAETPRFHQPLFHAYMAAYWVNVGAKVFECARYLQTASSFDALTAHPLPSLTHPELVGSSAATLAAATTPTPALVAAHTPFPMPTHILALLRRIEEQLQVEQEAKRLAGIDQSPTPVAAPSKDKKGDKDKDKSKSAAASTDSSSSSSTDPNAISSRALMFLLLHLRQVIATRSVESHVAAVCSVEERVLLDLHQFLAHSFQPYQEHCTLPLLPADLFPAPIHAPSSAPPSAQAVTEWVERAWAGVKKEVDEKVSPGFLAGVWSIHSEARAKGPQSEEQVAAQPLTLTLLLSTEVTRGGVEKTESQPAAPTKGKRSTLKATASSTSNAGNSSSGNNSGRRKKSGQLNGTASELGLEGDRSTAQQLFGADVGRFQLCTLQVARAEVSELAAEIAELREKIQARLAAVAVEPSPAAGSAPASSEWLESEKVSFVQLLLDLQEVLGSQKAVAAQGPVGVDVTAPVTATTLPAFLEYFQREYALTPSLAELQLLERVLDCGNHFCSSFSATSNGLCFFLHQFSRVSVQQMESAVAAAAAAAALAAQQRPPSATGANGPTKSKAALNK